MSKPKSCVISDESINSYGFYLLTAGADLKQYKKNPILLWMHNRSWRGTQDEILPIGKMENLRIEDGKVLGDPVFDLDDSFAADIARKWENGFLRMVSAGVKIITLSSDPKYLKKGQTREAVVKWKLKEVSIVDIGSNDNSMAFYDEDDKLIKLSNDPNQDIPVAKLNNKGDNEMTTIKLSDGREFTAQQVQELSDNSQAQKEQITTLTDERDDLRTKLQQQEDAEKGRKKAEVKTLLDTALSDGRIDAKPDAEGSTARDKWEKLFENDHESAKAALEMLPKRKGIHGQLNDAGDSSQRVELAKLSWDELDHAGKLATLKESDYDLYEEKFEEKFGSKPKK